VSESALETQVGGDHYKKLGNHQPWQVLRTWLTQEEFRGYMKGTAIAYLAREQDKGGLQDVEKAAHTLQGLLELLGHSAGHRAPPAAANDNTQSCPCGSLPVGKCPYGVGCND
jgi:hypothetical protein